MTDNVGRPAERDAPKPTPAARDGEMTDRVEGEIDGPAGLGGSAQAAAPSGSGQSITVDAADGQGTALAAGSDLISPDGHYRWDASAAEWVPRAGGVPQAPHATEPPPMPGASHPVAGRAGRFSRRTLASGAAVLVAAVAVVAVLLATTGGSDNSGDPTEPEAGDPTGNSSITDKPTACQKEAGSLMDLELNQGLNAMIAVVGTTSPLFGIANTSAAQYNINLSQYGRSEAGDRAVRALPGLCTTAGNPILTEAQVNDLASALGDSPDTDTLNRITVYAS